MQYTGEIENGQMHGKGSLVYPNKEKYEGDWVGGKLQGHGVDTRVGRGVAYAGEWRAGKRHGRGVTTTRARGKEMQYETEWEDDVMVSHPIIIEKSRRTKKPRSEVKYSTVGLAPADLTKWKVKEDATELPMEHFLRIKLL